MYSINIAKLKQINQREKDEVFGYYRKCCNELSLCSIPKLIPFISLSYYYDDKLFDLLQMGFNEEDCREALHHRNNDIAMAIEYILNKEKRENDRKRRRLLEERKKNVIVNNEQEMINAIRIIFEDKYKSISIQIAQNLMQFYSDNNYVWNDIVNDFQSNSYINSFSLKNVIETLNSVHTEPLIITQCEKKFVWGLLRRCKPRI